MEACEIASIVLLVSVGTGLVASVGLSQYTETDSYSETAEKTHEHALFHVVINGSEKDFTDQKFQLNARSVHLENNRSAIVHKHRTGAEWKDFLETINTSYWRSNSTGNLCLKIYRETNCGSGAVYLNGEEPDNLEREIFQGDNLLIIIGTENRTSVVDKYMKKQLPPDYKPASSRGNRV
ncbi:MAG: hypothetical protein BRC29_04700 [Nanohaloarchaea archaeon SW_7_43_1]|nr:MAG: hypothetical protein BRC29_04700 [Nanohaloarchaea archaeon SW_7_43_1]